MATPEYDPAASNQHAQLLFDSYPPALLPALYAWLSEKNIDANVMPHAAILALIEHTEDDHSRVARGDDPINPDHPLGRPA